MHLFFSTLLLPLLLVLHVKAESFSNTNIQYLIGIHFDIDASGETINDGRMGTITIEHFGTWEYGSNFFFVDVTSAEFDSGKKSKIYGEYSPTLSLSKMTNSKLKFSIIKDIQLAAQLNQGDDFRAWLYGAGMALDIPAFDFVSLYLYGRNDNYNEATFQTTLLWRSSFFWGSQWVFDGFADYYGVDSGEILFTQPRLLFELSFLTKALQSVQTGIELSIHGRYLDTEHKTHYNPQWVVIWNW